MATFKCLACGHDNNVGDESCSSCSSSLNLKLCSVCEAINAHSAEHCHGCKADFRPAPEITTLEADAPPAGGLAQEGPPVAKYLPTAWRMAAERARKRSTKLAAALWLVSVLAAGLGSYFYAVSRADQRPVAAQKVDAAQTSGPAAKPEVGPRELARPQTAEPKQPQAPAASGKIAPARTPPAPTARSTPPSEPKRTTAAVTHTRAAGADASARTTAVALPGVAAPAAATPAAAAPVPAASAPILPVSEPPAASVTHTKTALTQAAAATAAPAAATEGRTVPAETRSDESAGCAPAVAALGLCKSK
jgi:hypothetical protein